MEAGDDDTRHPAGTALQAFVRLKNAVELSDQRDLSDLEEQEMIQAFE